MGDLLIRSYSTNICAQLPYSFHNTKLKRFRSGKFKWVVPDKILPHFGYSEKAKHFLVRSCSVGNSTSSAEKVEDKEYESNPSVWLVENEPIFDVNDDSKRDNEVEYLANDFGWKVRRLANNNGDEIRNAAKLQAGAFYEPTFLFDDFFFHYFQGEVLAGLMYKLEKSPLNRYACLVAEPETIGISNSEEREQILVGIVDVTALRDQNVIQNLPPDAEEYLYVSGIAVSQNFRRKKIATVLLQACDMLSISWGFKYLVLRAYEDDHGARELYSNAGYRVVSGDPPWLTTWVGRKRRLLMMKNPNQPSHKAP